MNTGENAGTTGEPAGHSHHAAGPTRPGFQKISLEQEPLQPLYPRICLFSTKTVLDGSPGCLFSFDAGTNYYHFLEIKPEIKDSILMEGKAFLQGVFGEYVGD